MEYGYRLRMYTVSAVFRAYLQEHPFWPTSFELQRIGMRWRSYCRNTVLSAY
jgi:hypothetical protein